MEFSEDIFRRRIASMLTAQDPLAARGGYGRTEPESGGNPVDLSDLSSIPNDESFVQEAYRRILGRECDASGLVNCLEMLRAHTPRRVVLLMFVNSDEARQKGRHFTGIPDPPIPAMRNRARVLIGRALQYPIARLYEAVRRIWLAPFHSVDQKLSLVLREIAVRSDNLSGKIDQVHWALSKKLDDYVADLHNRQRELRDDIIAMQREIRSAPAHFEPSFEASDEQRTRQDQLILERPEALVARAADTMQQLSLADSEMIEERLTAIEKRHRLVADELRELVALVENATRQNSFGFEERRRTTRPPVLQAGDNVLVTEVDGLIIGIPGEEWRLAAYHVFRGLPEPGLMRRFRRIVTPGMVVVDIGANIGLYTLQAARILGGRGTIHSFEPTPRTFRILRDNVQLNGFLESGVVQFHESAVTDRNGTADLAVFPDDCGNNTLFFAGEAQRISVNTVSLDEALKTTPVVDVVKIDAEGAEPFILRGMRTIVQQNPGIHILLEFAPVHLRRAGIAPCDFLAEIASLGLEVYRLHDETGDLLEVTAKNLEGVFSTNLELHRRDSAAETDS